MKKITVEEHINKQGFGYLARRLKDMDEAGIDIQVLSYPQKEDEFLDASDPVTAAKNSNNALAKIVEKYPERFAAFASIALEDPDIAANELDRAVAELGFKGTMLWGDVKEGYLHDHKNWVVFETAVKLDVPVYLHMGGALEGMMGALAGRVLGVSTCLKAMGLIFSGVFDEYPDLKIILGHLGEAIPFWLWRLDNRWEKGQGQEGPKPAWLENKLQKKPSQYFKDHFYVTTSGMFWLPAFQLVYLALGADRILFAADYPPESAKEAAQFIDSVPICDVDKEKICHLNAEKLLRL